MLSTEGGRIVAVDNSAGIRFPFSVNQPYNRTVEAWAENNGFLLDGVDLSKENRRIFGIRVKDIPQGHPLRFVYPDKFR